MYDCVAYKFSLKGFNNMSLQKLLVAVLPQRWLSQVESNSRTWVVQCSCGQEHTVWDLGGIQFRGTTHRYVNCPECGLNAKQRLVHKRIAVSVQ